ncbi:peptidase inhibitor family I36 protein [Devosia rhodophyticola]|uniref:Peptidase inhibitor family I36 protein n=1 Tax=Devosia rhodophyticola TaxID=3026423 RepID=A0ABY7YVA1_9HYPH|nr:peptidase inhibitor family I36 protein [Devosia rhodophyticola]WDR05132.1 peptidase inhibitor family I36 protein [Devosia rhodophyticola]
MMHRVFARSAKVFFSILALLAPLLLSQPASAAPPYGSAAWSTTPLLLQAGPGNRYAAVGTIPEDSAIRVERCSMRWCKVRGSGQYGWAPQHAITFGQTSADHWSGPRLNYGSGGSVCLYTGTNYTGTSLCASTGQVFRDLVFWGNDNRYSSIKVNGTAGATVCRDAYFSSYCARIVKSQPVLNTYLNNNVSSIRVY